MTTESFCRFEQMGDRKIIARIGSGQWNALMDVFAVRIFRLQMLNVWSGAARAQGSGRHQFMPAPLFQRASAASARIAATAGRPNQRTTQTVTVAERNKAGTLAAGCQARKRRR